MPGKWVDIDVSGENMEAYVAEPEAEGKYPAVIVIQEVWGVNSHIQMVTDRLPSQGFVGLAPQMFHREGPMIMALHEERETAFARAGRVTDDGILADLNAAVSYLRSQPNVDGDRIGIVGFCFGGRVSYLAATSVAGIGAGVSLLRRGDASASRRGAFAPGAQRRHQLPNPWAVRRGRRQSDAD